MRISWVYLLACVMLSSCKFPDLPPVGDDGSTVDSGPVDASQDDGAAVDATTDGVDPDGATVDAAVDAPPGPTYTVGGTASGMWTGAAVAVEISAPPNATERITVSANGTFAFPTALPSGRAFSLTVPANGQPFMHSCVVQNPNGTVTSGNITDRVVSCTPQVAMSVAFTAPIEVPFNVSTTSYGGETAEGVQETRVTVTAPGATSITVNGASVTSGSLSGIVSLRNSITVRVVIGSISQNYVFGLDYGGPDFAGPVYAKSSNSGPNDQQGVVSASGNLLAVGAPLEDSNGVGVNGTQNNESSTDSGAVYIYRRVGLVWNQEAYIKPAVNQAGARFGASVSLHNEGNTAVLAVGAPSFDGGGVDTGAAYVFRRSAAGVWSEEQRIQAGQPSPGSEFGSSVSINRGPPGYALAVGAPRTGVGSAYIFRFSTGLWSQEKQLFAPNLEANDLFGSRVSIFGGVVAVGAPGEDSAGTGVNSATQGSNAALESGAAYVYRRNGAGTDWIFEAYVKASNTDAGDAFGTAVSIEANVLVIGAPMEDSDGSSQANNSYTNAGAAYAFEYVGGAWTQSNYLKHGINSWSTRFGHDVSVHGDLVLVGAPELDGNQGQTGFARYFVRGAAGFDGGGVVFRGVNGEGQDAYGMSVSASGEGLFVGAPQEDSNGRGFNMGLSDNTAVDSGAVYGHY